MAQHADLLGHRTHELRLPLQHSLAPTAPLVALLDGARAEPATLDRVSIFADAILPALGRRMTAYLAATDTLLDAPTVRILERIAGEQARMITESHALRRDLGLAVTPTPAAERFAADEAKLDDIVAADPVA